MVVSDCHDGASRCDLHRCDLCHAGPWRTCSVHGFKGHCSHVLWDAPRKKTLWVCEEYVLSWALHLSPAHPLPVLAQGLMAPLWVWNSPSLSWHCSSLLCSKGLEDPGLGVVDISDYFGLSGTLVGRLQAEVRPQGCRDGRISVK